MIVKNVQNVDGSKLVLIITEVSTFSQQNKSKFVFSEYLNRISNKPTTANFIQKSVARKAVGTSRVEATLVALSCSRKK